MNEIRDPTVRFYLKHQRLIEEWARVAKDAAKSSRVFLTVHADLRERVKDMQQEGATDGEVVPYQRTQDWPNIGLRRSGWPNDGYHKVVRIGIEWDKHKTTFVGGWRLCGLGFPSGMAGGSLVREKLIDHPLRTQYWDTKPTWPACCPMPEPDGEYWNDLTTYRDSLVETTVMAWTDLSPVVDEVLGSSPACEQRETGPKGQAPSRRG